MGDTKTYILQICLDIFLKPYMMSPAEYDEFTFVDIGDQFSVFNEDSIFCRRIVFLPLIARASLRVRLLAPRRVGSIV